MAPRRGRSSDTPDFPPLEGASAGQQKAAPVPARGASASVPMAGPASVPMAPPTAPTAAVGPAARGSTAGRSAIESAIEPALGLLELDSIAAGIEAGDAMAKRAPIEVIRAGTVHPGKYLVLVGGAVADVEEALAAGREVAAGAALDTVFLPNVHPGVVAGMRGMRLGPAGEALGVIETMTVAATIEAADAGLKGARVRLLELHLADDLGGKGYLLFDGPVSEVEAAVEIGVGRIAAADGLAWRVIPRLHAEMADNLAADARFAVRVQE